MAPPRFDVAIMGGGFCGLALAAALKPRDERGRPVSAVDFGGVSLYQGTMDAQRAVQWTLVDRTGK